MLNPIDLILDKKKFNFPEPELEGYDIEKFDHYMTSAGIRQFNVKTDNFFNENLVKSFAKRNAIEVPSNWKELKIFFDLFQKFFSDFPVNYPRRIIEFGLDELFVKTSLELSAEDAEGFLNSCKFESLFFNIFLIKCLSTNLNLTISLSQLRRFKEGGSDLGVFSFLFPELKNNPSKIEKTLEILQETGYDDEFLISALAALVVVNPKRALEVFAELGKVKSKQAVIIQSVRRLEDGNFILDALKVISEFDLSFENERSRIETLVNLTEIASSGVKKEMFEELLRLTSIQDEKLVSVFFNWGRWLKLEESEQVLEILKSIISNVGFTEVYIKRSQNNIIPLAWLVKDLITNQEDLLEFLKMFSTSSQFSFESSFFSFSLKLFLEKPQWLVNQIPSLLIDDIGKLRLLGFRLFEYLLDQQIEVKFEESILELDEEKQLKLLISLNTPFSVNKLATFRAALFLIFTQKEEVCKLFFKLLFSRLKQYEPIIEDIKKYNIPEKEKEVIISRLSERQDFLKNVEIRKRELREFDASYNYRSYVKLSNELFSKSINATFDESKKTGLMGLFKHRKLLKGGGWRNEGETEIRRLGRVQSSFNLPTDLMINPDKESFKTAAFFGQNWNSENWKTWLIRF